MPRDTTELSPKHPPPKMHWKRDFRENAHVARRTMFCLIRASFLQQLSKEKMEILQRILMWAVISTRLSVSSDSPCVQQISLDSYVSKHLQGDLVDLNFHLTLILPEGSVCVCVVCFFVDGVSPFTQKKIHSILFILRKN